MKEYKVVVWSESMLSKFFFGEGKVNERSVEDLLNKYAREGWEVKTLSRENRRTLLFAKREALVFILEREVR
ncbi:MAG: DUF4177 domain-containing protein [Alphaproteobacteria bacterium]|nr:DUF4177 domain-containing protein [Alphaproteobacteria bacterium]